ALGRSDGGHDPAGCRPKHRNRADTLMAGGPTAWARTSPAAAIRPPASAPNKWLVVAAVTFGTLMGTVDASIVNVALPSIQAAFGVSITEVTWISTGYLIAFV